MFAYLGVLVVLALLSQYPSAILIGLFAGIVPGMLLWISNTLLPYSLAIIPARSGSREGIAISALLVGALAVIPGWLGQQGLDGFAHQQKAQDFARPARVSPRTFKIPEEGEIRLSQNTTQPECGDLCQKLLFKAGAEAVTIEHQGLWRFSLEKGGPCQPSNSPIRADHLPRIARGDCLIQSQANNDNSDVVIQWTSRDKKAIPDSSSFCEGNRLSTWLVRETRTLEISERVAGSLQRQERRTEVKGTVAPIPFFVAVGGCKGLPSPLLAFWDRTAHPVQIDQVLSKRYRIAL